MQRHAVLGQIPTHKPDIYRCSDRCGFYVKAYSRCLLAQREDGIRHFELHFVRRQTVFSSLSLSVSYIKLRGHNGGQNKYFNIIWWAVPRPGRESWENQSQNKFPTTPTHIYLKLFNRGRGGVVLFFLQGSICMRGQERGEDRREERSGEKRGPERGEDRREERSGERRG